MKTQKCTFKVRKVVETRESRTLPLLRGNLKDSATIVHFLVDNLTEEQLKEADEYTEVPLLLSQVPPETSWRKATGEVRYTTVSRSFYKVTGYAPLEGKVLSVSTEDGGFRVCVAEGSRVALVRIGDLKPGVSDYLADYTCPK